VKRSILVTVEPKQGETQDKMIRRFFRKCKKQGILEEHIEKTSFFKSKSQQKRFEFRKRQFEMQKNKQE
jgi:ribosomal protein S21